MCVYVIVCAHMMAIKKAVKIHAQYHQVKLFFIYTESDRNFAMGGKISRVEHKQYHTMIKNALILCVFECH